MRLRAVSLLATTSLLLLGSSCSVFKKITENPLQKVTEQVVNSTVGGSEDNLSLNLIRDAASTITAEQEHYLGRAVGAHILLTYQAADAPVANTYLNTLGQTLAMASERPNTHGGYHFAVTDSDDIHAFAAPGGFIFVSKGLLMLTQDESELAAVLAHEIAHVQHRHAVKAIKASRLTGLVLKTTETALSEEEEERLLTGFVESIEDIAGTLLKAGYSKKIEYQADSSATKILENVGYAPASLARVLSRLDQDTASEAKPGAKLMANHPPAPERLARLAEIGVLPNPSIAHEGRQERFHAMLASLTAAAD